MRYGEIEECVNMTTEYFERGLKFRFCIDFTSTQTIIVPYQYYNK